VKLFFNLDIVIRNFFTPSLTHIELSDKISYNRNLKGN